MTSHHPSPSGLWLPLITPFREGALDEASLRRLVRHYAAQPIDGLILAATTGEGLTLDEGECARLVEIAAEERAAVRSDLQVYLGLSGSDTRKLLRTLERTAGWSIDGYLVTCPYYVRPSQDGLFQHFSALAEAAVRPILIYNIPYRSGINLANEQMLRLAEHDTIVGVKDCCADAAQSFDLLCRRPESFAVLTGEDALFYSALVQGADGGILMSAHVLTGAFAAVRATLLAGDQPGALAQWRALAQVPALLFAEPSPAPVKHWLWRIGLIDSPELRLPMTGVSAELARRIDQAVGRSAA
ncbi:4-hydroxy-tetrahydrodipicolinate synthase [Pelagibius sp.]|uniref:4-hydroxy-tetrahydrodipicolinate synthase n=1 Tax=Pelagibius sp. TaxID=1931238 RepID=UPI002607824E|nr:4-hydroxy-tetrahydrodipicolinate synthase [Pelagibius sp.]